MSFTKITLFILMFGFLECESCMDETDENCSPICLGLVVEMMSTSGRADYFRNVKGGQAESDALDRERDRIAEAMERQNCSSCAN